MNPTSHDHSNPPSRLSAGASAAAMPPAKMRRIAPVRLDAFKRFAAQLKRALNLKHRHALTMLARACGYAHYHELHTLASRLPLSLKLSTPRVPVETLASIWLAQLNLAFGANIADELGAEAVDAAFRRIFVTSPAEAPARDDGDPHPTSIRDPALIANDWRDPEFRDSLHRQLGSHDGGDRRTR